MTLQLIIAPAAKADLADIYAYSQNTWGEQQADDYMAQLKNTLWLLTEQPDMGADRSELATSLRGFPVQQHTVFYRRKDEELQIALILHGRQDPTRHAIETPKP